MRRRIKATALGVLLAVSAAMLAPVVTAQAYNPTGGVMYQLPAQEPCLKGLGNCVVYPKTAQLPSGRLVAAFEKSTVVDYPAPDTIGGAVGQTLPIWKSDDSGTSWQPLSEVRSPAELSNDPAMDKYTSNWTSPYLYVLPQDVGNLRTGTLVLASLVTGEDEYYRERKAADPSWVPTNDGDRRDLALALYASTDEGVSWEFVNIIATGGWQGGSAGATGTNVAQANTTRQVDPVWEPHLMVRNNRLVTYYSDENDYLGYNTTTGVPTLDPANDTAPDSHAQILAHRTWDGTSAAWSAPVVDVAGDTFNVNGGQQIGGGRPGMTTIAPTTDGRWILTFEYWGGGSNVRYKIADDPLRFFADGDPNGLEIGQLPVDTGSRRLATGGSPVIGTLPDGRIIYNAAGSGSIWMNDGSSTGTWTEYQTTVPAGYSRPLQYVEGTGRVAILSGTWGGATTTPVIRFGEVDLGQSNGAYQQIVNRKTGQVIGTGNNTNDANLGNADVPDVRLEAAGSAANPATQLWHVTDKPNNTVTLLNKSGGRAAGIWTGNATAGQRIGQWVDNIANGLWTVVPASDGYVRLRSTANTNLYLTGSTAGAPLTLETSLADGSQEWQLNQQPSPAVRVRNVNSNLCADVWNASTANQAAVRQYTCNGGTNQQWTVEPVGSSYRLVNVNSGKCLEIPAFNQAPGTAAVQYTCNGGTNQLWTRSGTPGGMTFRNVNSGLCLEVFGFSTANGAALVQYTCNGGTNQRWIVG
ncbi:RICIN domain-containing protein [Antribacter sp. KLBMP9083]|uniref:RICIN domain-containing protein n=1 Tax=Antribacter soli TaxID=2910976 RepID=A0AA41QIX2_9MICO|nr:RICIN domain-containing protein [Antribacter soli]MCF4123057.1 RICIN domain-containing protein [Antribacter soli]